MKNPYIKIRSLIPPNPELADPAVTYDFRPQFADPAHIPDWWGPQFDEVLARYIGTFQWAWLRPCFQAIFLRIGKPAFDSWIQHDALCKDYGISGFDLFLGARANKLGLTKQMEPPAVRNCLMCGGLFNEGSLAQGCIKMWGAHPFEVCDACIGAAIWAKGTNGDLRASRKKCIAYLQRIGAALQEIPPRDIIAAVNLSHFDFASKMEILSILKDRPSEWRIMKIFGSWIEALLAADVLPDGMSKTSRGIRCLANDGHLCLSLGEKKIDDFLHARGILHEREVLYPSSRHRADFRVSGAFIEYFGLHGNPDYDVKSLLKRELCKRYGIRLIELVPGDLVSPERISGVLESIGSAWSAPLGSSG